MIDSRPMLQLAMIVMLCGATCGANDGDRPDTDKCKPIEEIDEYASVLLGGPGETYFWANAIEEDGRVQVTAFFYRQCAGDGEGARRVCTAKLDGKQVVVTTTRHTNSCDDDSGGAECESPTATCGEFQLAPGAYELVYDHCKTTFTVPGFWVQCS